jgi:ABC-type nickel/cobalt efflux system permease component RcnA
MNEIWAAYAAALALGAAHALEVDHMAAVSAFVGGQPRLRRAVSFGLRWGLGHSVVVLVAGGLLAWSGISVPPAFERWGEALVGVALVAVGCWAFWQARRLHVHVPASHGDHGHLHSHPAPGERHDHPHPHAQPHPPGTVTRHDHAHLSTLVGAVHGLAGTAPVVALIPVTLMSSLGNAIGYLLAFGVGTTVSMAAYAAVAALAVGRATSSVRFARVVAHGTAGVSVAVGCWWLVRVILA